MNERKEGLLYTSITWPLRLGGFFFFPLFYFILKMNMVTALSELAGQRRTFTSNHELTAHWHIPHQIDYFLIDYIGWYRASRIAVIMMQIFLWNRTALTR